MINVKTSLGAFRSKLTPRVLTRAALVAALYTALTLIAQPISFGAVQFRVSEALTLLPVLLPEAVPGLFVGCLLSNLLGGAHALDIIFGSLATLGAAIVTFKLRRRPFVAALAPVLSNAVIVGILVHYLYAPEIALPLCCLYVGLGEAAVCYVLGLPLLTALRRLPSRYLG